MLDLGIVKPGSTIYVPFQTFDSNDPQASVTITGLATTDIEIYKDGSTTQRASDSGYALLDTDGIDFDTTTGIHGVSIDLADNTTAGFYASGSQYWVVIASITVDAATINFIPVTFRIGYPDALLNTTIATLASQTSFTLTTGPAEDNALNGCIVAIHDVASAVQMGFAVVSDYTGSTKTVTLTAGTTFTAAATDNIHFYPPVNVTHIGATAQTANDNGADINTLLTRIVGTLAAGTHNPASAAQIAVLSDWIDGGRLDLLLDAIKAVTDLLPDSGALSSLAQASVCTETRLSELDAATAGKMANQVDEIRTDTEDLQTQIGTDGAGLTNMPWNAAWDAEVQSEVNDALVAFFTSAAALVDLIWDEPVTGHTTNGTAGKILKGISEGWVAVEGTINDGSPTTTSFITDLTETTSSFYADQPFVFISGALKGQSRIVTSYNGTTKTLTFDEAFSLTPSNGDQFIILATHIHAISEITDHIDANSTQLAAIVADTNELQNDWADGGRLDNILDSRASQTTADAIETDTQSIESKVDIIDGIVDNIIIDTNELQGDWTDGGRLDVILDAILADTGTDGVVLTAAERNAIADAILDRDMSTGTDSGSATVRTVRQALRASRNKVSISGGTMTVTKEDDTTASWTAAVTTTAGDPISAIDPADA
jgi:hypothetical protein